MSLQHFTVRENARHSGWIVTFKSSVLNHGRAAQQMAIRRNLTITSLFTHAHKGCTLLNLHEERIEQLLE
jgi:hypothetical protein